ncbi:thiol-disulfide oxidoreductase DCC family protein [Paenibacillus sp. 1001270B_150601_E10]|uniref:thiol-disulfide oxidoreductase DCC family protein n=1 Tax=Paenibacillus sp. 1001270B_150601_E10 TaxID=2787079 RepID=UPI00189F4BDE|nr:thiol-disulfide oxidoreductase DCC family protein [Paenibacillus sp. 1001270B_150601_E10]
MERIVFFDGECNFCDKSVQFIIKRDPSAVFSFASLQSEIGKAQLQKYHVPSHIESFVLIEHNKYYVKSTAALRICKHLKGLWKLCSILLIVPRPIRDAVYTFIAKRRYRWFGKKESCTLPSPEIRKRFLS